MKLKTRNFIAKDLFSKKYRKRIVRSKKGKGSYKRKKNQFNLAPIFWMIFEDISVPFFKLSLVDKLFT